MIIAEPVLFIQELTPWMSILLFFEFMFDPIVGVVIVCRARVFEREREWLRTRLLDFEGSIVKNHINFYYTVSLLLLSCESSQPTYLST